MGIAQLLGMFRNKTEGVDFTATDDTTGRFLPSNDVGQNQAVAVQAQFDNGERLLVGLTDDPAVELEAGQSIHYEVKNTDDVYIEAQSSGDGVNVTVETED